MDDSVCQPLFRVPMIRPCGALAECDVLPGRLGIDQVAPHVPGNRVVPGHGDFICGRGAIPRLHPHTVPERILGTSPAGVQVIFPGLFLQSDPGTCM